MQTEMIQFVGRDRVSAVMQNVGRNGSAMARQLERATASSGQAFTRAQASLGRFSAGMQQAGRSAQALSGRLGGLASGGVSLASQGIGRLTGLLQGGFLTALASGTAGIASFGAAAGLLGRTGVEMNLSVQGATATLTTMLGSSAAAQRAVAALRQEAAQSTPTFEQLIDPFVGLTQSFKDLTGAARAPQVALRTLRAFGDTAVSTVQGDTNRLQLALVGFRQLLNRPFAQQEELNQIGENLNLNVGSILRRRFGTADTEALQQANITGAQVAQAIIEGMERQFGGAQRRAAGFLPGIFSNILDAGQGIAARITEGLTAGLTRGASTALALLQRFQQSASGAQIMQVMARGFTAIGDAVAYAATKLPALLAQVGPLIGGFTQGVASLVKFGAELAGNQKLLMAMQRGLANVGALVQTVIETLTGLDFKRKFDPDAILAFFEKMWQGVRGFIAGVFGMGRAFNSFARGVQSLVQDIGDKISDMTVDARLSFEEMFARIVTSVFRFSSSLILSFAAIGESINQILRVIPGAQRIDTSQMIGQGMAYKAYADIGDASIGISADAARNQLARDREARQRGRLLEDPDRNLSFADRIGKAFRTPDQAQEDFFRRLDKNAEEWFNRFRGGAQPVAPQPAAPNTGPLLYGQRQPGGASVQVVPQGPAIPAYPGGGMLPHFAVPSQPQGMPYVERPDGGFTFPNVPPGQMVRGAGTQINQFNIQRGMTPREIAEQVYRILDEEEKEASYGRRR